MKLLKSQKDEIFDLIENSGLSPSMFYFDEINSTSGDTTLKIKDWEYFFKFRDGPRGGHYSFFCPGNETYFEGRYPEAWSGQKLNFRNWIIYVKRELTAPDKWNSLKEELEFIDIPEFENNNKFTYQEYELLTEKINTLKDNITKIDKLEGNIDIINEKLDHLLTLAKDLNKRDWKDLFLGSIISLIMQMSIDKDTGQLIWGYIKSVFSSLIAIK